MSKAGGQPDRVISWLGVLTATILVVAVASQNRAATELRAERESLREIAYLDRLRLQFLGEPLSAELMAVFDPDSPTALHGPLVIWIVDPTDCNVCDEEARLLNRTIIGGYPRVLVVMSGVSSDEGQDFSERWGLRVGFVVDSDATVRGTMGLALPSSFLVLNKSGRVVHLDAHQGTSPCRNDVLELARRLLEPPAGSPGSPRFSSSMDRYP